MYKVINILSHMYILLNYLLLNLQKFHLLFWALLAILAASCNKNNPPMPDPVPDEDRVSLYDVV